MILPQNNYGSSDYICINYMRYRKHKSIGLIHTSWILNFLYVVKREQELNSIPESKQGMIIVQKNEFASETGKEAHI